LLQLAAPTAAAAAAPAATAAAMAVQTSPRAPKALSPRVKASAQSPLPLLPHAA
jgi:hypothetical protein